MVEFKRIIFALAITLLFIPMVYLGINTFFPDGPIDTCYDEFPHPECYSLENETAQQACYKDGEKIDRDRSSCYDEYRDAEREYNGYKYVTLMIICLLAAFVMLAPLDFSIVYGLFGGVVFTVFTGTLGYMESKSKLGFFLLVVFFGTLIYFIQREYKKPAKKKK